MMRLRLASHVVLVTLLATSLAGCSNAPGSAEEADQVLKTSYVDADNKTHGLVAGVVLTVAGDPLPGALVTILSVDGSLTSDSTGKFQFTDVAEGEQTLRVEKANYRTLQRPFTVVAGKIVELEVVVTRADGLGGGAIDHFHDKWRGQELYTIFEGRIEMDDDVTTVSPESCFLKVVSFCQSYHPIVLDEGRIVPPGTDMISIDISFAPDPMAVQYRWDFYIYPPPGPDGSLYDAHWGVSSGDEHLEYDVPLPEITDHGHAISTSWGFALESFKAARDKTWPEAYNMLFPNPVDVTITAHKGELAIDPPHPKYWADADRIEMPTGPETYVSCTVAVAEVGSRLCSSRSPNPSVGFGDTDNPRTCLQDACMILDRGGLVPPGTTRISFDLEMWHSGMPRVGTEPPTAFGDTDWVLGFKTAAPPRGGATWDDYTWVEPVETFEPEPQQGRFHQQGLRYMIDVPAGGEDPYYTLYSAWIFMMAVRGHETASDYSDIACGYDPCGYPYFELKNFFVHNDSPDPAPA